MKNIKDFIDGALHFITRGGRTVDTNYSKSAAAMGYGHSFNHNRFGGHSRMFKANRRKQIKRSSYLKAKRLGQA